MRLRSVFSRANVANEAVAVGNQNYVDADALALREQIWEWATAICRLCAEHGLDGCAKLMMEYRVFTRSAPSKERQDTLTVLGDYSSPSRSETVSEEAGDCCQGAATIISAIQ